MHQLWSTAPLLPFDPLTHAMHLHAGGAVHLQYFMPQHQPEAATDLQYSAVRSSSSTSPPATMWEYHQAAALQSSSSSFSFPSWSPYAGTTTGLLGPGSTFAADSSPSPDMRLPAAEEHVHGHARGQHGEQSNNTCYRENFLDLLASKNMTPEMFEDAPASQYAAQTLSGRFGAGSEVSPVKYEMPAGSPLLARSTTGMHQGMNMMSSLPRYAYVDHLQMKEGSNLQQQQQELGAPAMASFLQQLGTNASVGLHCGMDYSGMVLDKICQEGRGMEASPFSMKSLPDFSSLGGYRSTSESTTAAQPYMRRADLSQSSNKQEQDIVPARSSSTGSGAVSDCKKRQSEERTSKVKKSKQEGSKASPPKQQVPKVKIGEKITALQQIVSPFGKTDTASVLFETIKYIKFLHEQVQLLSEPYTNSTTRNKGNVPWGGDHAEASKQQGEAVEHDLRDRGLCLVPVSWTPQVYRDGTAMDYWTPAYRGCLYR